MHHALIKIALKKRKSTSSFAQGEKWRKKLLLAGPVLALRECRGTAAGNLGVSPSGTEAELLNSLGKALCICVYRGVRALVCISSLQRGLGSLAPAWQELLTPRPRGSSQATSTSLDSVAIAQGCKTHR